MGIDGLRDPTGSARLPSSGRAWILRCGEVTMIRSAGLCIDNFFIPPFCVEKGELLIIELPAGGYFPALLFKMVDLLIGKEVHKNVAAEERFRYIERIPSDSLVGRIFPMTIRRYIAKYGSPHGREDIYKLLWANMPPGSQAIEQDTRITELSETSRRLLSLFTVCSWTDRIVFDLWGVDPAGAEHIYAIVKSRVAKSGAAVLVDYTDEFRNDCSRWVRYERWVSCEGVK